MTIVRRNLNELAGPMEKDPHGDFLKVKELLLIEINKYVKKNINGTIDIITPEIEELLKQDVHGYESIWKQTLMEKHLDSIIEQLNLLRDELNALQNIDDVGDLNYYNSGTKKNWKDKLKEFKPRI